MIVITNAGPLIALGFFEDLFDQKPEQTAIFWHELNKVLSQAA